VPEVSLEVGDNVIYSPDSDTHHRARVIKVLGNDRYLIQNEWPRIVDPRRLDAGSRPYPREPYEAPLHHLIPSGPRQCQDAPRYFHVTSSLNRGSIEANGLGWRLMAAAPGIAGSRAPEQEGCFLCLDDHEADWFVNMNNTGGPVDVWAVDGINDDLVRSPEGHYYLPRVIARQQLTLVLRDIEPRRQQAR
jgi:hypothetical protein